MLDYIFNVLTAIGISGLFYKSLYTYWNSGMGWKEYFVFSMRPLYSWRLHLSTFLPVKYVDGEDKKNAGRKIANIALYTFYASLPLILVVNQCTHKYRLTYNVISTKPRPVMVDSAGKSISDSEKAQISDSMKEDMKFKREP
jgi:hypothetical protein